MALYTGHIVNLLANVIISQYFSESRCIFVLSANDHFSYVGTVVHQVQIAIVDDAIDADLMFNYYGCKAVVIISNNPAPVFDQIEREIHFHTERFNERKYLIVPSDIDSLGPNYEQIFEEAGLQYVSDFLVVVPVAVNQKNEEHSLMMSDLDLQFELKSHQYVGISDRHQPYLLDKWFSANRSFLFGNNLYPDKLYNQQGRPIRMATFNYPPYTIIADGPDELYGSNLRSAVTFARLHNMTPVLVVNDNDFWGDIFENYTGTGLLGNMVEDKADLGFVAGTWPYCYDYLDMSMPVVRSAVTCIVPAPKLLAGWLSPMFAFSSTVWIYIALVFVLGFIVYVIMTWCYGHFRLNFGHQATLVNLTRKGLFVFGKLFLVQSLEDHEIPTQRSGKFLIALMFGFALFWSSTYDSGFASVMTLPRYEKSIDTVQDLADSNILWGTPQYSYITAIRDLPEQKFATVVANFRAHEPNVLRKLTFSGTFGIGVERLPAGDFAIGPFVQEDIIANYHLMTEDLYWIHTLIMTRKSSVILEYLNRFVLRIHAGGLIAKWQNIAANKFMDAKMQRALAYYNQHPHDRQSLVVALKLEHVQGAFAFLIIGYIMSLVAYIVEVLTYRNNLTQVK